MTSRRGNRRAALVPGRGPLAKAPPALAFLLVIVLFGLGVWLGGPVGAGLLGVLLLGVLTLLVGTWHRLTPAERVARVGVLLVLVGVTWSLLR